MSISAKMFGFLPVMNGRITFEELKGIVCAANYGSDYNIVSVELNEETQTAALAKVFDTNIIAGSGLNIIWYDCQPFIYDRKIQRCYSIVQDADQKWYIINSSVDDEGVAIHTPIGLTEFDDVGGAFVYATNLATETASTRAFYYSTNRKYMYILLKLSDNTHKWVKVALSSGTQTLINEEIYDSEHYDGWPEDVETDDVAEAGEILSNPLYYDELTGTPDDFPEALHLNFTTKDTGDTLIGKWAGGVLTPSGKVVFVPYDSSYVGVYDPESDEFIAGCYTTPGYYKWVTGVLTASGKVVFVPWRSRYVGIYDPESNTFNTCDMGASINSRFGDGVLAPSGRVIFVPAKHPNIGIYDPSLNTYAEKPLGLVGWQGGVLTTSGKVVFVPRNTQLIGIYDPVSDSFATNDTGVTDGGPYGRDYKGNWIGGVLSQSGKVVFVPYSSRYIGIYDPDTDSFRTKDTEDTTLSKWVGGVLLSTGEILFVPYNVGYVGIYNEEEDTFAIKNTNNAAYNEWYYGVVLPSNKIVLVPFSSRYIGIIDPTKELFTISLKTDFIYNSPNKSELNRIFVSTRQIEEPVPPLKETIYYLNTFDKSNVISATGYKTIDGETTYYQDIDYTLMEVKRIGLYKYGSVSPYQGFYSDWHDPLPFISVGGQTYLLVAKNGRNGEGEETHTLGFLNIDTRAFISTGRTSYDSTPHIYVAPDNSYALLAPDTSNPIMLFTSGDFSNTNFKSLINIDTIERKKTLMCTFLSSSSIPPAIIDYSPAFSKIYAIDWETYSNMPIISNNKIYASLSEGYYIYDGNIGKLMLTDFDEDDEPGDFYIPSFDGYAGKAWIKWYAVDDMLGSSALFEAPLIQ